MVDLRSLMSTFPTGVSIVTAVGYDGRPWGMTCTSIASVSLEPPCLLVCLRCGSPTLAAALEQGGFALNLLRADAEATARLFASGAPDRFEQVTWSVPISAEGPHLTAAAHTIADCRVRRHITMGDHAVVFAEVIAINERGDVRPLLHGMREFAQWPDPSLVPDPG